MTTISISAMGNFATKNENKKESITLEDKVDSIQKGNQALRNQLLEDYQPFIKKITSKVCNRYINHSMDEFSIGLSAFNEAMESVS
ncbi:hypothetical protein [Bacillus sp. RAR_GA_16]|uniref:hypothetical protein n=1 Tax=Bacillus sp. RAR_GA_16 TaxID=2876774 RepID=UPI001CC9A8D3|nr:hypothetical protein [Bacillus sp. RAR_GA_16]MCA0171249.1 hypothetical protein [Bacillus sp. RAR_GA_16]